MHVEPSDRAAGETAHGLFRQPDVYPVLQDFHDIAATGWYGRPERADRDRAEEIAEAVADHVVHRAQEIWAALAAALPRTARRPAARQCHRRLQRSRSPCPRR